MKNRVIALIGAVLTAWVVGSSAYAVGQLSTPFSRVSQGAVSYGTPLGASSQMRSTSTMHTGTNYYAPTTGQVSTNRSHGGLSSGIGTTHQGGLHRGVYTVGATSPTGEASAPVSRARTASGPNRVPSGEGSYGEIRTDGDGTWWWDGEEWILIGPSEDMGDVTQPIGDAPWLLLLLFVAVYGGVRVVRRNKKVTYKN